MRWGEVKRELGRRDRGDRGSVSIWVVIFTLAAVALLVLVVDGGQSMNAKSRAGDIAEQAARAAANDVDVNQLRAMNGLKDNNVHAGQVLKVSAR